MRYSFSCETKTLDGFRSAQILPDLRHTERAAKIQSQIDRVQVGHGPAAHVLFQRAPVWAEQVHIVAQLIFFHGYDLPVLIGQKPFQLG